MHRAVVGSSSSAGVGPASTRHTELVVEDQVLALLGIVLVPVSSALTALWISARRRAKRAEAMVQQVAITLAARADGRGAELGQSVDALAREVERIADGQRFVSQLLEERAVRDVAVSSPPRHVTPH